MTVLAGPPHRHGADHPSILDVLGEPMPRLTPRRLTSCLSVALGITLSPGAARAVSPPVVIPSPVLEAQRTVVHIESAATELQVGATLRQPALLSNGKTILLATKEDLCVAPCTLSLPRGKQTFYANGGGHLAQPRTIDLDQAELTLRVRPAPKALRVSALVANRAGLLAATGLALAALPSENTGTDPKPFLLGSATALGVGLVGGVVAIGARGSWRVEPAPEPPR